jgi:hypothetical protein
MTIKAATAARALIAAALASPVQVFAAVLSSNFALVTAARADDATLVRSEKSWPQHARPRTPGLRVVPAGPDTVGSLGYDGRGYGYNRFSGQVYQSCMEDLGYGRVRPCDAGGR